MAPSVRRATHARSWYSGDFKTLSGELDGWLDQVPASVQGIGELSSQEGGFSVPFPGARAIIAPHAGYAYSGPAAAWAYKSADWASVKRVFLIGPSHHKYLNSALVTACDEYQTPLGNLTIDKDTTASIKEKWGIGSMDMKTDENEHSLEMHIPYIYKMLSLRNQSFQSDSSSVKLVPIMVGSTLDSTERQLGSLLSPFLNDPDNMFVISSDFCHWGSRFSYTYYEAQDGSAQMLRSRDQALTANYPIHESIKAVDFESMNAIETRKYDNFSEQLQRTENTVCGRHPIGVFMAAVEAASLADDDKGRFKFVVYDRSSLVETLKDSSVSYCSAFAVL